MDALLILSGIVLLAIGWVWLVIGSLRLPTGRLVVAILLPLVTLFRRDQGYPRAPRLVLAVGCLAALAGLATLFHLHPHRFERLVSGQWHVEQPEKQGIAGEIMGQQFRPDRVFWRGDDLVLEEGPTERVRRSLTIRFESARQLVNGDSIALLPTDTGRWPEVLLQWHAGALEAPGLRRITGQYSLDLDLLPSVQSSSRLRLHLALPSQHQTWVTGEVFVEQLPAWLRQAQRGEAQPKRATTPSNPSSDQAMKPELPRWEPVSVLALVDEPRMLTDASIRVTTVSGRSHEGRFKGVTDDGRIVLAKSHGPNQVDFQFHPVDIQLLEAQHSRR
ncbi:hypothetical protein SAMN05216421_0791 [Halopseudomonas xinjiangensis]|uniref:Uncharacterized protein n=1 Tax=Halopseudomonas xinjiangensis TaxID=487184 RepID=A0A1H1NXX6_9GAMM|nr:hypothetical protein [Halopseudomonas xinjiangensis]SDS03787.1 hypothetical protein SAMN05216421_0791 [Halopseudomonas xinjiangensis]